MEPRDDEGILSAIAGGIGSVIGAVMEDGTIAAARAARRDSEFGMALKAFPDSIQVQEPGTIFNPTQGEIAEARRPDVPLPGDLAQDNTPYMPDQGQEMDMGRGR